MESSKKIAKISLISKIKIKITQIKDKVKAKYSKAKELQSFLFILGEICTYGFLLIFTYLSFSNPNLFIKAFGFGCGLWIIIKKIVPLVIVPILSSVRLINR